ncbi:uncharacterized protein LOC117119406 isoform X2 [Anneissia japonica]|uniref:uncharacterized protein LOC117119406 isoform X2 n=1 Tax=Anneissia japonica TaxID=1529436 RepID=UPI0014256CBE|nr:uncharacterized protein LOC117119406 isoform X2 [Anneissia japonica]
MAFNSVLQMYTDWANSLLCEEGILIGGLHELSDGKILCKLLDALTTSHLFQEVTEPLSNVSLVLNFLKRHEVKLKSTAEAIVSGELKSTLDVMWAIILHCTVHSPDLPLIQRTVRVGKQRLLEWFNEVVPEAQVDVHSNLNQCFCGNNKLATLIGKYVPFALAEEKKDVFVVNLTNALLAAEDKFGLVKTLISPSDVITGSIDEHSLMIYIALLRRKVGHLNSMLLESSPSLPLLTASSHGLSMAQIHNLASTSHSFKFLNRGRRSRIFNIVQNTLLDVSCDGMLDENEFGVTSVEGNDEEDTRAHKTSLCQQLHSDTCSNAILPEAAPTDSFTPDIKMSAARNIERMLEERRLDFELDEEKMDGRSVQTIQRRIGRAINPEDELLNVLDAIAKACRHLKKELDQSQLRELYLIQELQTKEKDNGSPNDVIPKLVQELQVLRNENRRLFREAVIIKTEATNDKKAIDRLKVSVDRLQAEVEHLTADNYRLKLTTKESDRYLKGNTFCSEGKFHDRNGTISDRISSDNYSELPNTKDMHNSISVVLAKDIDYDLTTVNKKLEMELAKTTENLKKSRNEIFRLKQEKKLLKMSADTSKLEANTNLNRCQRLESLLVYAENNIGFGRVERSTVSHQAMAVPDVAADAKYLELLKKLDEDNALLRERLLLAEEDREILREEVRQYRMNASLVQQRHLMSFALHSDELYSSSEESRFPRSHEFQSDRCDGQGLSHMATESASACISTRDHLISVNQINSGEGAGDNISIGSKIRMSTFDAASDDTTTIDYTDSESMELLHLKVKTRNASDASSSVSGFSMDSKDDVFPALPSPIRKTTISVSSVEETGSIDDLRGVSRERKLSLGGLIVSKAEKSPPRFEESSATGSSIEQKPSKEDVFDDTFKDDQCRCLSVKTGVEDIDGETTLTQDTLNVNSPRLALGTSHLLKNTPVTSTAVTSTTYFTNSSTPKSPPVFPFPSSLPVFSDVKRLITNLSDGSDATDDEFKELPDQIEDPERLHDTSPKSINSNDKLSITPQNFVKAFPELFSDTDSSLHKESPCASTSKDNYSERSANHVEMKSTGVYVECLPNISEESGVKPTQVRGVEEIMAEEIINSSGSGLTIKNHSPVSSLPAKVYKHKVGLSPSDQQYANSIIDKYLRLLPLSPK